MTTELENRIQECIQGKKKTWWFDIDNTITETKGSDYQFATPKLDIINDINKLFEKGNTIYIFTGRGGTSKINHRIMTEMQLAKWGVKYDNLFIGYAKDIVVDDCSITPEKLLEILDGKL